MHDNRLGGGAGFVFQCTAAIVKRDFGVLKSCKTAIAECLVAVLPVLFGQGAYGIMNCRTGIIVRSCAVCPAVAFRGVAITAAGDVCEYADKGHHYAA